MTSFITPSATVHEKLPDSSTPSGSCQALPRPTPFGKTGEGRGERGDNPAHTHRPCDPIIRRDRPLCLSLYLWASTGASPLHTLLTFERVVASCTPFVFLCL